MLIRYPRRVTVNNKRLISECKKSEKIYAYLQKPWHYEELQREVLIISICLEDRNVFARFHEIPSMTL